MAAKPPPAAGKGSPNLPIEQARIRLTSIFTQRCVYLFVALLLLIVLVPFFEGTASGRVLLNVINVFVLVTSAVAVSRSRTCFTLTVILGAATVGCQVAAVALSETHLLNLSRASGAAFYFLTLCYLLAYVFRNEVLTVDKLYGAAAAFLMLGVLWGYFYLLLLVSYPGSVMASGQPLVDPSVSEMVYFSFTVLTSTGFGDIVPTHPVSRMLCVVEQTAGVLFIAILIARLAGTYHPSERS